MDSAKMIAVKEVELDYDCAEKAQSVSHMKSCDRRSCDIAYVICSRSAMHVMIPFNMTYLDVG